MVVSFTPTLKAPIPPSLSLPSSHARPVSSRRKPSTVIFLSWGSSSVSDPKIIGTGVNFYEMLSLSPMSASEDDVKRAFRSMALRYHPDVCDPSVREESTRMFVRLHEAYRTLSDPVLREEYDLELGLGGIASGNCGRPNSGGDSSEMMRRRWHEQVVELKRRSSRRVGRRDGTWGSRMRAKWNNMED